MSADREKAETEEAAVMARQITAMGFSVEIEDRNSLVGINFNEYYQTQDYENARYQYVKAYHFLIMSKKHTLSIVKACNVMR
jgi:hypothetical protein